MRRLAPVILQCAALLGFAASVWLVAQYQLSPEQMLCGKDGGCQTVRACAIAGHGLLSWPTLGVIAYGTLLALSLSARPRVRAMLPWAGLAAGVTGVGLILAQRLVCHAFCEWCLVTDTTGVAVAIAAWAARGVPVEVGRRDRLGFAGLATLAAVGAAAWVGTHPKVIPASHEDVLPPPIAHEQRPGVATIVEFADFECPFCRRQHQEMKAVLDSYGPRVHLVRKHVPLSFHPHAADAARAACCAEDQGHGDEMANALFETEDLTPQGCERLASGLGLNMTEYRECVSSSAIQARLDDYHQQAADSHIEGLPTMFVGHEKFLGVVTADRLRGSIDRALQQAASPAPPNT